MYCPARWVGPDNSPPCPADSAAGTSPGPWRPGDVPGRFGSGYIARTLAARGSIDEAGIRLPGKGVWVYGSTTVVPSAERSPERSAAVGTVASWLKPERSRKES